ncbi:MAG: TonB-dependent receptor, partial [Betaproteobacteria bacterium]|nr:TonB-dependent receptor [Betaproteobacteria bacterium]
MRYFRQGVLATGTGILSAVALHGAAQEEIPVTETVVITATREQQKLVEIPAAIGVVPESAVQQDKPTHPSQTLRQVPGVSVAVTNGEGHTTAIRHPFTTNPVYLFLEDGVPTRSTGFFNHNALYEINVPQSAGVEVIRGPATALYGSDAIGGVVNAKTRQPPDRSELYASLEAGSFGWRRLLAGGGAGYGTGGLRADINLTQTDGWRAKTSYDRQGATLRWDHGADTMAARTVLAYSKVDQETGANSPLIRADYDNNPTRNNTPIAFRKVEAVRLYSALEWGSGDRLISVTPYFR